jgi:hypothetical protein
LFGRGTQWHSWLRHCATNWNIAGLIPNGVSGIFSDILYATILWLGFNSACNKHEYQEYFLGVEVEVSFCWIHAAKFTIAKFLVFWGRLKNVMSIHNIKHTFDNVMSAGPISRQFT